MKKIILKSAAMIMGAASLCATLSPFAVSAISGETTVTEEPTAEGRAILDSVYADLGYNAEKIEQISRTQIPAELYVYIDANSLPIPSPATDTIGIEIKYDFSELSYFTNSNQSIVSSYSTNDTTFNSVYRKFTGTYTLSNPSAIVYSGNITAVRFQATTIGNDLHLCDVPSFSFTTFTLGSQNFLPLVSSYLTMTRRIPGDVNCDGYVRESDCQLIARFLGGDSTVQISSNGMISADADRNGVINTNDISLILQVLDGTVTHF